MIECVKLRCLAERAFILTPTRRIRLRAIEPAQLVMASIERAYPRVDVARWTVPRAILDDITSHRDEWVERMPDLFSRGFVSLVRYLGAT